MWTKDNGSGYNRWRSWCVPLVPLMIIASTTILNKHGISTTCDAAAAFSPSSHNPRHLRHRDNRHGASCVKKSTNSHPFYHPPHRTFIHPLNDHHEHDHIGTTLRAKDEGQELYDDNHMNELPYELFTPIHPSIYSDKSGAQLPTTIAYPHRYQPHPIAIHAADRTRDELLLDPPIADWDPHDPEGPIGKMIGVLVVRKQDGTVGYYKGYSGTLRGETSNVGNGFVPLVYDRMDPVHGFWKEGEEELEGINRRVDVLLDDPKREECRIQLEAVEERCRRRTDGEKVKQKLRKGERDRRRAEPYDNDGERETLLAQLVQESNADQRSRRDLKLQSRQEIAEAQQSLQKFDDAIQHLKTLRRQKSSALQNRLFSSYRFLNVLNNTSSLLPLFTNTTLGRPPSGAGDCALIKLLQHAFLTDCRPIAAAEFWWGRTPPLELRRHGSYYPACRGKCEPILLHMLQGLPVDPEPIGGEGEGSDRGRLDLVYEDDWIVVVDKPSGTLSVPGKSVGHSVYGEMKARYPNATGPLLVHRLDMSTSGILLVAKDKDTHKELSRQFAERTVKKRYTAVLEGGLGSSLPNKGRIDLPLSPDYVNRPMQRVDFQSGKNATTHYEVVAVDDDGEAEGGRRQVRTRVKFYPVTGRTHQLRVHAAHPDGLDLPIVGDDIYGSRVGEDGARGRMCLHAGWIEITHPSTGARMAFTVKDPI